MSDEIKNPTEKKPYRAIRTRNAGRGIADRVREIIQPTADELGYYPTRSLTPTPCRS